MGTPLSRFRVMAWATGVMLLILVFVAMPLKYAFDKPTLVELIGPIHGALYAIYVLVAFHYAALKRFSLLKTVGLLLAGTIPFASFYAERYVVRVNK